MLNKYPFKRETSTNLHEVSAVLAEALRHDLPDGLPLPAREAWLVVWHGGDAGPGHLVGRAQSAEDAEQLVDLAVTGEQGAPVQLKSAIRGRIINSVAPQTNPETQSCCFGTICFLLSKWKFQLAP